MVNRILLYAVNTGAITWCVHTQVPNLHCVPCLAIGSACNAGSTCNAGLRLTCFSLVQHGIDSLCYFGMCIHHPSAAVDADLSIRFWSSCLKITSIR